MTSSRAIKIGIGREPTWGAAVAPQVMLPVEPPSITEPFEQLLDQLPRGLNVMDFGAYQGVGHVEASFSGHFYPEEIGFILLSMFGDVDSDGETPPYTHTFELANQPPSLSFQSEGVIYPAGALARRYSGMLPSSLSISFSTSEGLLAWSSDFMGGRGTAPAAGDIPADATNEPFRGWHGTMSIDGSPDQRLIDAEISIEREIEIYHAADGTQFPVAGHSGAIQATTSLTFDASAYTELDRVLAHDTCAIEITFSYGSGADLKEFALSIPDMNWGEGPVELDHGGVSVTLAVAGRAIYNRDTQTLIGATLKNARTNYDALGT